MIEINKIFTWLSHHRNHRGILINGSSYTSLIWLQVYYQKDHFQSNNTHNLLNKTTFFTFIFSYKIPLFYHVISAIYPLLLRKLVLIGIKIDFKFDPLPFLSGTTGKYKNHQQHFSIKLIRFVIIQNLTLDVKDCL